MIAVACPSCGLTEFERDSIGRLICGNCDRPAPASRMATVPCATPRCGQPVPADSQPWHRCLVCGQPIKTKQKTGAR